MVCSHLQMGIQASLETRLQTRKRGKKIGEKVMERTIKDEVYIAIYAMRYAYTRKSVAPSVVSDWIKTIAWKEWEKDLLIKKLNEERDWAVKNNQIDEINQPYWDNLVMFLEGSEKAGEKKK